MSTPTTAQLQLLIPQIDLKNLTPEVWGAFRRYCRIRLHGIFIEGKCVHKLIKPESICCVYLGNEVGLWEWRVYFEGVTMFVSSGELLEIPEIMDHLLMLHATETEKKN